MSERPALQIALALRGDSERLRSMAENLRTTNLGPAMKDVRDAARLLGLAARRIEEADAAASALRATLT